MADAIHYIFSGLLSVGGGAVFIYGFNRMIRLHTIQDTPTSKIRSMAVGLVEVKGKVSAEKYIRAPFSGDECIYYKYDIVEYKRRTSTDSKGNTKVEYVWETVASGKRHTDFTITDETGSAVVKPQGSEFNVKPYKIFYQKAGFPLPVGELTKRLKVSEKGPGRAIDIGKGVTMIDPEKMFFSGASVGDRRYHEYLISPGEQAYVLGTADSDTKSTMELLIRKGMNDKTFIISDRSEKDLVVYMRAMMIACFIAGGFLLLIGLIVGYLSITGVL